MTVGEKIQYYRKQNGMSREELGQKLFVSRQTVSLWEMDKTLPTELPRSAIASDLINRSYRRAAGQHVRR